LDGIKQEHANCPFLRIQNLKGGKRKTKSALRSAEEGKNGFLNRKCRRDILERKANSGKRLESHSLR